MCCGYAPRTVVASCAALPGPLAGLSVLAGSGMLTGLETEAWPPRGPRRKRDRRFAAAAAGASWLIRLQQPSGVPCSHPSYQVSRHSTTAMGRKHERALQDTQARNVPAALWF